MDVNVRSPKLIHVSPINLATNIDYTGEYVVKNSTLALQGSCPLLYNNLSIEENGTVRVECQYALKPDLDLLLRGGALNTNKLKVVEDKESLGALTIGQPPAGCTENFSTIDFGTGPGGTILRFASIAEFDPTQTLIIKNWSGHLQGNGRDRIIFDHLPTGERLLMLLSNTRFEGYAPGVCFVLGNELVPKMVLAPVSELARVLPYYYHPCYDNSRTVLIDPTDLVPLPTGCVGMPKPMP